MARFAGRPPRAPSTHAPSTAARAASPVCTLTTCASTFATASTFTTFRNDGDLVTIAPDSGAEAGLGAKIPSFRKVVAARPVVVRRAVPDDAARLHRIAAETFPLACPPDAPAASILSFIAEHLAESSFDGYLADPGRELFLAEVDGDVVGYTMVVYGEPTDADVAASVSCRPTAELSKVYIAEAHHGGGAAAALVETSAAAAVTRGMVSLWLGVNDQNVRANRFYEKSGFARVGTKKFHLGGRVENDFVRERLLDPTRVHGHSSAG